MAELEWTGQILEGRGSLLARGADCVYLITGNERIVVLTRWRGGDGPVSVARQAALNAIQIGGAWDAVPEAVAGVIGHLKQAAQQYESGLDVTGQPAWWHGHNPR
jgi:phosphatidylserine decarboxylase